MAVATKVWATDGSFTTAVQLALQVGHDPVGLSFQVI
jgi:hypothetical protein